MIPSFLGWPECHTSPNGRDFPITPSWGKKAYSAGTKLCLFCYSTGGLPILSEHRVLPHSCHTWGDTTGKARRIVFPSAALPFTMRKRGTPHQDAHYVPISHQLRTVRIRLCKR